MRRLELPFRTLFRTPFVTIVAILSLGLGIGANAGIYSLFNEILLAPLPVSHPNRLVNFASPGPQVMYYNCGTAGDCDEAYDYPMFRDLERAAPKTSFSGIAGHMPFNISLAMPGQTPIRGDGILVSGSYFPVLGIQPALGRLFARTDDQPIEGNYVTVLSYAFWQSTLGANPAVLGKQITVNGQSLTIVGVAPRGFSGTTLGVRPDVFVPISMAGLMIDGWKGVETDRDEHFVYMFGRLAPGATMEQAAASLNPTYHAIINNVEAPRIKGMGPETAARFRGQVITLTDGRRGQSSAITTSRLPLTLLFAVTGVVLLIACANIANLLLARAANRTTEMAVRLSLGATRRQLITQVLTESVLLAVLGGIVSVGVAYWTLGGITALLSSDAARSYDFHLSAPVFVFTAVVSLATGLLFGLAPALSSTRPDLVSALRNNSGKLAGDRGAQRFRASLVTVQIALSMALLIGAGLFIKSLRNISRVDLGIDIENVVQFGISPARSGYDSTRTAALYDRIEQTLAALPGVRGVTSSTVRLLGGNNRGRTVSVEGFRKLPDADDGSRYSNVGPNYFHVLGVPLLAGRDFTAGDRMGGARVAIVNEAFAKKFNLGHDAVGKHMSVYNDSLNIEVVGLARDAKYSKVKDKIPPVYFLPLAQSEFEGANTFYVRTALPTDQSIGAIRSAMKRIDPNLPLEALEPLPQQVRDNVYLDRMISDLTVAFALLATLLAAIGLYGVLAYSVAQRTREIGVRMALGANAGSVQGLVLRQVGVMTLIGGAIGIAAAMGLGRAAQSLLYGLQGYDPVVIAAAAVALALVAFAAGFLPALKASRVDPMQALRYE
ncbi:MAG: ABC transporter permease [Deltaproteobacteria bacterium]